MSISINSCVQFLWAWNDKFLLVSYLKGKKNIETYVWSDPDYGGDNTIRPFLVNGRFGTLNDFLELQGIDYLRDKGFHTISQYCGYSVNLI